jgi:CRISPR-associated protein (TIGR02584 family)
MHHILFSVVGKSPAVITETLYGLWDAGNEKHVHGGEVHVLTTKDGWAALQGILGDDGQIARFNRMYETAWEIRPEWIEVVCEDGVG